MIRMQDNGYWLFDLGSFNGSYLNGARVTAARQLKNGDVINFADHEFRYEQAGSVEEQLEDLGGSTIALIRSKLVVILVSDIQGFTALSESLSPDDLAHIIGNWYSECEIILSKHGATVDKFTGDCVLAYWTETEDASLINAAKAARDLLESCQAIYQNKKEVFDSVQKTFGVGVAMHTGKVAYGGMSQGEFTLVGDPVNLTFRLESLTRKLDCDILVSKEFLDLSPGLKGHCENFGVHEVKGRGEPVEVWGFRTFPD